MSNIFSFTIIYTIKINQDAINIDTNVVLSRLYNHYLNVLIPSLKLNMLLHEFIKKGDNLCLAWFYANI